MTHVNDPSLIAPGVFCSEFFVVIVQVPRISLPQVTTLDTCLASVFMVTSLQSSVCRVLHIYMIVCLVGNLSPALDSQFQDARLELYKILYGKMGSRMVS